MAAPLHRPLRPLRTLGLLTLLLLVGGALAQDDDAGTMFAQNRQAVADNTAARTRMLGFSISSKQYAETSRSGGYLIGFEIGLGKGSGSSEIIHTLTPVFHGQFGDAPGQTYGWAYNKMEGKNLIKTPVTRFQRVTARAGYCVSGLRVHSSIPILGMAVQFSKITGTRIDPADSYWSDWIGTEGKGAEVSTGEGPALGAFGNLSDNSRACIAVGLIYRPVAKAVAPPPPEPKPVERPKVPTRPKVPIDPDPVIIHPEPPVKVPPVVTPPPTLPSAVPTPVAPTPAAGGPNWALLGGVFALVAMAVFGVFYALSQKEAPVEKPERRPPGESRRPMGLPPESPADAGHLAGDSLGAGHLAADDLGAGHLSGAIMEEGAMPREPAPRPLPERPLSSLPERPLPPLGRIRDVNLRLANAERVGFGPRFAAALIDAVAALAVGILCGVVAALVGGSAIAALVAKSNATAANGPSAGPNAPAIGMIGGAVAFTVAAIFASTLARLGLAIWEAVSGAALGKRLLKLRIRNADGRPAPGDRLLLRAAAKYSGTLLGLLAGFMPGFLGSGLSALSMLASLVIFVGCFMVLGEQRLALHDLAAGTAVFPEGAPEPAEAYSRDDEPAASTAGRGQW